MNKFYSVYSHEYKMFLRRASGWSDQEELMTARTLKRVIASLGKGTKLLDRCDITIFEVDPIQTIPIRLYNKDRSIFDE